MEFLYFFLISLVSYLGLLVGYILMLIAPEEHEPGLKFFKPLGCFVFLSTLSLVLLFSKFALIFVIGSIFALLIYCISKEFKPYVAYFIFAIIFYVFREYIIIFSVLIFAYGLIAGAMIQDKQKPTLLNLIFLSYFVVIANLLRLIAG